MALPLPRVIPDAEAGGGIWNAYKAIAQGQNAIKKGQLENQFYAPDMQSQIGYRNSLAQGQNIQNQYMPDKLRLANQYQQMQNQMYIPNTQSQIGYRNALAQGQGITNQFLPDKLRLANQQQAQENQFYPAKTQSMIDAQNALSNYRNMGGPGMGVDQKQLVGLKNQIKTEHPEWNPFQVNAAISSYLSSQNTLPDGSPLAPPSGQVATMLDEIAMKRTPRSILTGNIKSDQAEAEIGVLNDFAQKGMKEYGDTTFGNMSPSQIIDTFKSDDKSQKRLGRFIASQALQYEIAQNRIRLANGQPGVTSTEELMKLSGQMVKTYYPQLTQKARKEASDYMDDALSQGLKARESVSSGASRSYKASQKAETPKATLRYNPQTGDFEDIK